MSNRDKTNVPETVEKPRTGMGQLVERMMRARDLVDGYDTQEFKEARDDLDFLCSVTTDALPSAQKKGGQ